MRIRTPLVLLAFNALSISIAQSTFAEPILHIHDGSNRLATIDIGSGEINQIGQMGNDTITDIAFDPDGNLFGLSFTQLYEIDVLDAHATPIGPHGIPFGNALVFNSDGTLYAAGATSTLLYTIDTATGESNEQGEIGFTSAGDLAFNDGHLFLSSNSNELIQIDLTDTTGSAIGFLGFVGVFGLATDDTGVLFGVSGTQIFEVDTTTGAGSLVLDYSGNGLGPAFGTSFVAEAIPEPATLVLLLAALLATKTRRTIP